VEEKVRESDSEGISFVNDIAWVIDRENVGENTQRLE
jgi:hypothetical protein